MTPQELFQAGKLTEALSAALEAVKHAPTDENRRGLLCELCCFVGDLERADRQLETIGQQNSEMRVQVAQYRQLIRAEQARQQFFSEGRMPDLLAEASGALRLRLQASVAIRENQPAEAARLLAEADAMRKPVGGTCNGNRFDEFRDCDDLTADVFEVLTSVGKYYWIPVDQVELIEFRKPERPRDLLWRGAHMVVRGGPDAEVFVPCIYAGSHLAADDALRLGRATDWQGGDSAPVRGIGQRTYLVGDDAHAILELETIRFDIDSTT